jgi:hypothetical protein
MEELSKEKQEYFAGRKKEELFFDWWAKVEHYQHLYNLRMAWDEGYRIATEQASKKEEVA